jgi:hypothetical protein
LPPAHAANLGSLSRKKPPLAKSTVCYAVISVCRLRSRDRLFAGWAHSELVALDVADLAFEPEGVVLRIGRSKTDREGAGATVAVPLGAEEGTCPVGGAEPLAGGGGDRRGARLPLDRSAWARGADALGSGVGRDRGGPRQRRGPGGRLRRAFAARGGFATAAARAGRSEAAIMGHGGSKSVFGAGDLAELNVGALPKEKSPTG